MEIKNMVAIYPAINYGISRVADEKH